jgi:hypothetical protein
MVVRMALNLPLPVANGAELQWRGVKALNRRLRFGVRPAKARRERMGRWRRGAVAAEDDEVRGQRARSRAAVVLRALERERRRRLAEHDAEILAASRSAPNDLDALASHSAHTALDID